MSQSHLSSAFRACGLAFVVLASVFATGCATVGGSLALKLPGTAGSDGTESAAAPQDRCMVVIQPAQGKPDTVQMPLGEGATVQTALDFTKATRKFSRMEIHVLRTPPGRGNVPGQTQKMNVEFNRKRHQVEAEYDYALHPNDRIIVKEDPTTIIDDTIEAIAGRVGVPLLTQLVQ